MTSGYELHQLSESQKSIWYLEKAYPGTSINIVAGTLRLKGNVNYGVLEKALNLFVRKSDAMRLQVHETDGIAMQYVTDYEEFKVDFFDFSAGDGLKDLFAWDEANTRTPFNMDDQQLFYCATFKVSDDEGGFYMKMHHLISDAWTMGLFTRQVIDLYSQIRKGLPVDDNPNPSYIEHLISEAEYEKSLRFENDKSYWIQKFNTLPEMTVLKPQKNGVDSIRAKRKTLITPLKLSNKIREFCSTNRLSVFTLFMSALAIYINRVTGIEDIILGTTILNRVNARDKETPGMFVSVAAPVRISVNDTVNFKTFAAAMLKENTDVLRHQKYPYNYLIRDIKKRHKLTGRLFDIVLTYQNSKFRKGETEENYVGKWLFSGCQVESLIISINDREDGGNLIIDYDFLTDVFDIKEIDFINQHIISILWHALDDPFKRISKLEMISEKEKRILLRDFNSTYADFPIDKTISQMFEEQVERSPESTAIVFRDQEITYTELNQRANKLADTLRKKGIGPDKIVGIMANRSFELIIGIMGVLKAGGAYLPIDPSYPKARKSYMLGDSDASLLLMQNAFLNSVEFSGGIIDLNDEESYTGEGCNPPTANSSGDLAYIMYTSGSTGNPKGVMIQHAGVVNSFCWGVKKFGLTQESVVLQKTSPTFDPSVWEILWWLMLGGKVCLINSGDEKDPEAIICAIEKHQVTEMHFVPSMLGYFLNYVEATASVDRLRSLRHVFSCGEAISLYLVQYFNRLLFTKNHTELFNMYGPTEATVEVACFDCSPELTLDSVPIGSRIDNFNVYILDKNWNLLPVGIPGEVYISGVGVGRGYINNNKLTAERFLGNPFLHGEKMYRTGDKARWYPKGDIEFLGRMDLQVKVKGYRIEIGEIESKLLNHPDILEAAVKSFAEDGGGAYLAAYIVSQNNVSADDVRAYLVGSLPEYMIPSCITFLDKMPLNDNGKIDRNALPEQINRRTNLSRYDPPSNDTEATLCRIWAKCLGINNISVTDEFSSLGGDSLHAIAIVVEINKKWGIQVTPKEIFHLQNIRELAKLIKKSAYCRYTPVTKIDKSDWYPMSAAQKRQFMENQLYGDASFHITSGVLINGLIEKGTFQDILKIIIRRHESLRTNFMLHNGLPVQVVHEGEDILYSIEETDTGEDDIDKLITAFIKPFNLAKEPLFRAKLVNFSDKKHLLILDMHHIISDGGSNNILMNEIAELIKGRVLPEPKFQYKDFAAWHNGFLESEEIRRQEAYWLNRLSGELPVLKMPLDFKRPSIKTMEGNRFHFIFSKELTKEIKGLAAATETTLYMVMMSAYSILLSKYTGQQDIIIGITVEGRNHPDTHDIVGAFFNTPVVRNYPAGEKTFRSFLNEVKEELLDVYDNQDYPFEKLVLKLGLKQDPSRYPLYETLFMMHQVDVTKFETDAFNFEQYNYNNRHSKVDLGMCAFDGGETITCRLEYCTKLFKAVTMECFAKHYERILYEIVKAPLKKIREIGLNTKTDLYEIKYTHFIEETAKHRKAL